MENYYTKFIILSKEYVNKLKAEYRSNKIRARNKIDFDKKYFDKYVRSQFSFIQNKLGNKSEIVYKYLDIYNEDKSLSKSDAFDISLKKFVDNDIETFIIDISEYNAILEFQKYLYNKINTTKANASEKRVGQMHNLFWKSQNETELIQLLYALNKAGYLLSEPNKIETVVSEFSRMINFNLSKNWRSNHSKSIHKTKKGYESKIFDTLKDAYASYQKEKQLTVKLKDKKPK